MSPIVNVSEEVRRPLKCSRSLSGIGPHGPFRFIESPSIFINLCCAPLILPLYRLRMVCSNFYGVAFYRHRARVLKSSVRPSPQMGNMAMLPSTLEVKSNRSGSNTALGGRCMSRIVFAYFLLCVVVAGLHHV